MDSHGVLTALVAQRRLQPEPVATAALVHLLRRSPAAASALTRLCGDVINTTFDELEWSGQVSDQQDSALPDLVGKSDAGTLVVLEAKFQAELTQAQLDNTYVERLAPGSPGLLLYLAPDNRLPRLWRALREGPAAASSVADVVPLSPLPLSAQRWVAVVSWEHLLDHLSPAVRDTADAGAVGDLEQLRGLVLWRIGTDWVPLAPADLTQQTGRQLSQLLTAVLKAVTSLGYKTNNGTSDSGAGRWLVLPGGPQVWVGMWLFMLGQEGGTPLWMTCRPTGAMNGTALAEALSPLWSTGVPRIESGSGWAIPLLPLIGAERSAVILDLEKQIKRVIDLVTPASVGAALPKPGVEAEPGSDVSDDADVMPDPSADQIG